jgi:hypothetical protein
MVALERGWSLVGSELRSYDPCLRRIGSGVGLLSHANSIIWVWLICDQKLRLFKGKVTGSQPHVAIDTGREARSKKKEDGQARKGLPIQTTRGAGKDLKSEVQCGQD